MSSSRSPAITDFADIGARVDAYVAGRDAAVDLDAVFDAIAASGERPVWISVMARDKAHALLERAKERLDAGVEQPLFGIPFAVKDNIDVAGMETTAACPEFAYTPDDSAFVVQRLIDAGAIPVGKTNLDQFATGLNGSRSPYGIPSCVFDDGYVSGGSSSGSAVAVAQGLVPFALGTDTAGSGRVPAGFNNIVGLKPSRGLISARGVVPACRTLDCVSILAGSAQDAMTVLRAASAPDAQDPYSRAAPQALDANAPPRFRFGMLGDEVLARCAPEVAGRYLAAAATLEMQGGEAVHIDYAPFEEVASLLYAGPWVAERLAAIKDFAQARPHDIHPVVREIVLSGANYSAVDGFEAQYRLAELMLRTDAILADIDVIVVPTAPDHPTIAAMLDAPIALNSRLGLFTNFVNLLDLAAISVPAGWTSAGLPVGVTLIGPAFSDGMLAMIGDRLHRADREARLGDTAMQLEAAAPVQRGDKTEHVRLAVVGAHLRGQPLNGQLTGRRASFVKTARTAGGYSLYALPNSSPPKPGLQRDGGAGLIEIELWDVPLSEFGSFVALIPPPLGIGSLELDDGSVVKGFICESHALADAADITAFGGWRTYLASANPANQNVHAPLINTRETRP
ncbi:allophanate hydrolase [Mesorhizobium sp. CAU 1741]|uniref:allophanate hydrolase n=1 Tax=Mesorhizobium sp. CAU 1741 TaxID=3140366 RepID=UPI00325BCEF0